MESTEENDVVYPMALLFDELKNDDVTVRLNAMQRLSTVALALGEERCREELIPFCEEVTQEDEDEVLSVLAEELGKFVPYIGGIDHVHLLIPPLEVLTSVEENIVRDKAVASLNHLCDEMSTKQAEELLIPLIKRVSSNEWFSSRVSSTGLYAHFIAKISKDHQLELQSLYRGLTQDEAPMVRRASATHLPEIIAILPDLKFEGDVYTMFQALVLDDQDSVRLLSVDVLISIAESLKSSENSKYNSDLISFTMALFNDKSWRVRYMVADRFEKLAKSLDSVELRERFVPAFVKLMKDNEAEVRKAIAKQIPGFSGLIPRELILSEIIPNVEILASDSAQEVRAALASEINRLAPLLGKDKTTEYLLPTFLQMLKDEYPEVRLNIISKLQVVNDVIGIELLSKSLLPAISDLAKDKQWRIRLAIIEHIPLLAKQLGVSFFDRELGPLCMTWLWDSVYSIREAATINLKNLCEIFGIEWTRTEIIPHVVVVGSNSNYLYRLTALFAVSTLIPVLDKDIITNSILPFIENLINDPIPNIRFNIAKAFKILVESYMKLDNVEPQEVESLVNEVVIPRLEKLCQDSDADVRYFSKKSLDEIREIVEQ